MLEMPTRDISSSEVVAILEGFMTDCCKMIGFEVGGLDYIIIGIRKPTYVCIREPGFEDPNDDAVFEALHALVKGW